MHTHLNTNKAASQALASASARLCLGSKPCSSSLLSSCVCSQLVALQDNEIVSALVGLFQAFARQSESHAHPQEVDPTELREALGRLPGGRFRVGQSSACSIE